jgi:Family of unknown function (DUF5681)
MRMSEATIRAQWKTGQSGNPKGRPKRPKCLEEQSMTVTRIVRMLLDQPCHVLGSDGTETFLVRLLRDMRERADQGDEGSGKFLLRIALRADHDRLQALRASRKAKNPRDRAFEEYVADLIAQPPPTLRPDQHHLIVPGREVRTERLKPKPRRKYNPEPELYNKKGEINPWYLEKCDSDPLAHLPKHLPKEEVRAAKQAQIDEMMRRHREMREADAKLRAEAAANADATPAPMPEIEVEAVPTTAPKTAPTTGLKTGLGSGLLSGLRNALLSKQPIGAATEFPIRVNDAENFAVSPKPNSINGAHVNGSLANGSHHNGSNA